MTTKTSGIFRLTNNLPEYRYVGYSSQIETCTHDYKKWCEKGKHPNKKIQEAYNAGGDFKVEILEVIETKDRSKLDERRRYWLEQPVPPSGGETKTEEPKAPTTDRKAKMKK
jgi:hypothetical protein